MENIGATLEDVFIALVDQPKEEEKQKRSSKQKKSAIDLSKIPTKEKN
jgi:hypothetical protein